MELLKEGQQIHRTYQVERFLGEGAFAEVYRVKHRFMGRQSMKVFKRVGVTIEEIEQMLDEAIILSHMGHPNLIRVFDANVLDICKGICGFFTMEYVAGGSLEQFWRSYGSAFVPVEISVNILKQICAGLGMAHGEKPPIIHRDIKPANILVGYEADGLRVRISDFGLAKRVNPLTLLASSKGTRIFKPPEAFGDTPVDSCAGDVWSLGTTLYLLLTDRLPYSDITEMVTVSPEVFEKPLIPPSRLNLQVDPLLDQIVFRTLDKKPENRYADANALLKDLEGWKPRPKSGSGKVSVMGISEKSKTVLGYHSTPSEPLARNKIREAIILAGKNGRLCEAADMMEDAFNLWPELREEYEYQVKLWRRGLCM